ncbi:MAG: universal stress protein [Caulobacteraceae bacterium]
MAYKTILVSGGPEAWADDGVRTALDVARMFDAHVIGMAAEAFVPAVASDLAFVDAATVQVLRDQLDVDLDIAGKRFWSLAASTANSASWEAEVEFPLRAVSRRARGADLIVLSRPPKRLDDTKACRAGDLVMEAGTPVLVAPEGAGSLRTERVVVGWKDTRETRRAVADALPFLMRADTVYLVECAEEGVSADTGLDAVAKRLARHGVNVEVQREPPAVWPVAARLEDVASRVGANLVVVGAFGHSRMREWAFGGVTKDLIEASRTFILLSR